MAFFFKFGKHLRVPGTHRRAFRMPSGGSTPVRHFVSYPKVPPWVQAYKNPVRVYTGVYTPMGGRSPAASVFRYDSTYKPYKPVVRRAHPAEDYIPRSGLRAGLLVLPGSSSKVKRAAVFLPSQGTKGLRERVLRENRLVSPSILRDAPSRSSHSLSSAAAEKGKIPKVRSLSALASSLIEPDCIERPDPAKAGRARMASGPPVAGAKAKRNWVPWC
ncbi:MAG: hypothetical protein [Microviridae sp.]|nr:MAG: hypothetical protein [Microviridae sp.]